MAASDCGLAVVGSIMLRSAVESDARCLFADAIDASDAELWCVSDRKKHKHLLVRLLILRAETEKYMRM